MAQIGCPVCETASCDEVRGGINPLFKCEVCGYFSISYSALKGILHPQGHHLNPVHRGILSHRIREANEAGQEPPLITTYLVDDVVEKGRLPSPAQQAINIIRYVGGANSQTGNKLASFPQSFHAQIGSINRGFALRVAKQLIQHGKMTASDAGHSQSPDEVIGIDLTLDGWNDYEREQRGQTSGGYGFIALKFGDPVLDPFLSDVIKPAVGQMGFELTDMRDAAQAGIIDNVMRARIRDASFVLVDLTHANEGAYWEAGYAEGLGKPVLYLCNKLVFEEKGTHFDTNHCTTLLWDTQTPESFTDELKATLRRSLGLFAS